MATAVAAPIVVAASVGAATGSSNGGGLACPAGTKAMVQHATYDRTQDIEGFDSPEEAVEHLVSTAYPGMGRGQFRKVASGNGEARLESASARSTVVELDRLVPNATMTELVPTENGTAWVVEEFEICESDARRWAAR
ncbi:MAG TPA: hypothetical protein VHF47_08745 [Acidimicrobiales bacterium]|nr:hypothetical protein [Acidimicrobiales bacterium]